MEVPESISIGESLGIDPSIDPVPETKATDAPKEPSKENPTPPPTKPATQQDFIASFEAEMKASNPEFKLPDNYATMTPKEQVAFIKSTVTPKAVEDPFVESYLKAKERGLSQEDFLQQAKLIDNIKAMSSREFLINDLIRENGKSETNPNGWSKEDIEAHIDSMNKIDMDMKAKERKESIFGSIEKDNLEYKTKQQEALRAQVEEINNGQVKTIVDNLFTKKSEQKDIGGIPHTPEEQAEFKQMFLDAVSLNPETGLPRTTEFFNDDEVLYDAMFLIHKARKEGKGGLKHFLSTFKEEYKQDILNKTRIAPRKEGGHFQDVSVPDTGDFV